MKPALHLVNGASLAGSLRETGRVIDVAYWRESLYMGPLVVVGDEDFRKMRQEWWGELKPDWVLHSKKNTHTLASLTALLPEFSAYDSIVLWFEFDLYDQSMLWYILRIFAEQRNKLPPISIISPDRFPGINDFRGLGQLHPEQLRTLFGTEIAVSEAQFETAGTYWETFASNDPDRMRAIVATPSPFPYAHRALRARIKQFPQAPHDLGDIQLALLGCIEENDGSSVDEVIGRVMATYDRDYGLSDVAALGKLIELYEDSRGLIEFVLRGKIVAWNPKLVRQTEVKITDAGKVLLREVGKIAP